MIDWLEFFVRVSVNEYCLSQEMELRILFLLCGFVWRLKCYFGG
jgi:hypothetical protein